MGRVLLLVLVLVLLAALRLLRAAAAAAGGRGPGPEKVGRVKSIQSILQPADPGLPFYAAYLTLAA
jgi:hypothetical protein